MIEGNGEDWTESLDVPLNLTELIQNVKTSGHVHCFEMKNLWGTDKKKGTDEDEFVNPTEYFSFAISCDKDPKDLVERMSFEWGAAWMARN